MSWAGSPLAPRIRRAIWGPPADSRPAWHTRLQRLARLVLVLVRDLVSGQLPLRSMSLVYTTLLSLVPLLALSFSVLKAFGVHNQVEPALRNLLTPLGPKGEEITVYIVQFIERMNVGVLGSVGLALLLYTTVSLMQKIEESFNFIWHVAEPRGMADRFSRYLTVLMIGPILLFSAVGMTAAVMSTSVVRDVLAAEPLGGLFYALTQLAPYLLVIAAFSFIYFFVPNTAVRLGPAACGGIVGGVLWQTGGWAFAKFVASSTHYAAIYSSFAILVLFMIWLYLSWLILLFGASVAFYTQHPEYMLEQSGEPRLSNRMRERVALLLMGLIAQHHLTGLPAWTLPQFARTLGVPAHSLTPVLNALVQARVLARTEEVPPGYLPARDLSAMPVTVLLEIVRGADETRYLTPASLPSMEPVEQALAQMERALQQSLEELSVAQLGSNPRDKGTIP